MSTIIGEKIDHLGTGVLELYYYLGKFVEAVDIFYIINNSKLMACIQLVNVVYLTSNLNPDFNRRQK